MPGHLSDKLRQILDDPEQAERFHRHMLKPKRGEVPTFQVKDKSGKIVDVVIEKRQLKLPERSL